MPPTAWHSHSMWLVDLGWSRRRDNCASCPCERKMFLRTLSLAISKVADRTRVIFAGNLAHSEGLFLLVRDMARHCFSMSARVDKGCTLRFVGSCSCFSSQGYENKNKNSAIIYSKKRESYNNNEKKKNFCWTIPLSPFLTVNKNGII